MSDPSITLHDPTQDSLDEPAPTAISMSTTTTTPAPAPSYAPPPTYSPTRPQILVAPLPNTASFFYGASVRGDVFVKGLGQSSGSGEALGLGLGEKVGLSDGSRGVERLSAKLRLTNRLPSRATLDLYDFPEITLYPAASLSLSSSTNPDNSSIPSYTPNADGPSTQSRHNHDKNTHSTSNRTQSFPAQHRFTIPLPTSTSTSTSASPSDTPRQLNHDPPDQFSRLLRESSSTLPGTLNLSASDGGEIRWSLLIKLEYSGGVVEEDIRIEGTPQEIPSAPYDDDDNLSTRGANGNPHHTSLIPHNNDHDHAIDSNVTGSDSNSITTGGQEDNANDPSTSISTSTSTSREVEQILEKHGVRARLVLENAKPRLGSLLRLGVEVRPMERRKTGVAGFSAQPNPAETLRPLRRVRVEFFRRVEVGTSLDSSKHDAGPSSSTLNSTTGQERKQQHLSLLYTSGKSLRFPGTARAHPPLRVLFTLPTAQLSTIADQTWGETSTRTAYHAVSFFVRVTIGFGSPGEGGPPLISAGSSSSASASASASAGGSGHGIASGSSTGPSEGIRGWCLEKQITIRPKLWVEPKPTNFINIMSDTGIGSSNWDGDEGEVSVEAARAAYRLKGRDVVGNSGTYRADHDQVPHPHSHSESPSEQALPPPPPFPFDNKSGAGPSGSSPGVSSHPSSHPPPHVSAPEQEQREGDGEHSRGLGTSPSGLPTFLESEAQMMQGQGGLQDFEEAEIMPPPVEEEEDRSTFVGRRGGLGGELGTWVEYDGYETFSMAPPSMSASFGAGGSMDPPQEGDENLNVIGGMVARLGLGEAASGRRQGGQVELMEQLGLGEGTRVVDLQDDLPPGIDEPSLPALPTSYTARYSPPQLSLHPPTLRSAGGHAGTRSTNTTNTSSIPSGAETPNHEHPPSFAASEAAQALGSNANSIMVPVPSIPGLPGISGNGASGATSIMPFGGRYSSNNDRTDQGGRTRSRSSTSTAQNGNSVNVNVNLNPNLLHQTTLSTQGPPGPPPHIDVPTALIPVDLGVPTPGRGGGGRGAEGDAPPGYFGGVGGMGIDGMQGGLPPYTH